MTRRILLLAFTVALAGLFLASRNHLQADARGPQSLTTLVAAQSLTRDTNGDGLADAVAALDTSATNLLADRYGFYQIERYGAADRRHRLVTSGIVQLPARVQLSAIADFRSSLRFNPTSSLDLNGDGYTGDLPAGVLPGSGCRDMSLDPVNTFRRARGLTEVTTVDCPGFANVDLRLSKTFQIGAARAELIAQLFNIFDRANFNTPNANVGAGNDPASGRPLFGTSTSLLANINAPSRQAEFAVRLQF